MHLLLFGILSCTTAGICLGADAEIGKTHSSNEERPVVIVLTIAAAADASASEKRFVTELELALNRFRVKPTADPSGRFPTMSFAERLDLIRDLSKKHGAVATVWVERWTSNKMLLNLTAMSTGRALVKIVEVKSGPSAEADLAFAAEALLGEAYLFSPASQEPALRETVRKAKKDAENSDETDSNASVQSAVTVTGGIFGAIYERRGPSLLTGGGLSWVSELSSGWFFSPDLFGFGGPKKRYVDGVISGFGIQGGVLVGYHFHHKKVAIGPALGAGVRWQRVDAVFGAHGGAFTSIFGFRGTLSLDAQILAAKNLAVVFRLDLGAMPKTTEFKRVSNAETVLETPLLDGAVFAGFRYFFNP